MILQLFVPAATTPAPESGGLQIEIIIAIAAAGTILLALGTWEGWKMYKRRTSDGGVGQGSNFGRGGNNYGGGNDDAQMPDSPGMTAVRKKNSEFEQTTFRAQKKMKFHSKATTATTIRSPHISTALA